MRETPRQGRLSDKMQLVQSPARIGKSVGFCIFVSGYRGKRDYSDSRHPDYSCFCFWRGSICTTFWLSSRCVLAPCDARAREIERGLTGLPVEVEAITLYGVGIRTVEDHGLRRASREVVPWLSPVEI